MKHSIEELYYAYYGYGYGERNDEAYSGSIMVLKTSGYKTIKNEIKKHMNIIKKLMKDNRKTNECVRCFAFPVCYFIYNYMGYTSHDGVRKFVKYIYENIEKESDKTSLEIE